MTSILKEDDKIFTMYRQYKELIHKNAEKGENFVYGVDQMASRLVVAHMLDHVVCLFKEDELPTAKKVNENWKKVVMIPPQDTTSTSANVDINWGRTD